MQSASAVRKEGCKKSVVWDEENLEYNEANKSATMKIDEPDTPWASPPTSELDEDEYDEVQAEPMGLLDAAALKAAEHADRRAGVCFAESSSTAAVNVESHCTPSSPDECVDDTMEAMDEDHEEDEESEGKHKPSKAEFEQKRKQHYNEFEMIRRARLLMEQEEDEDEED
mmetsp:Transcript_15346/g.33152  ORF Transcript_15346/g.33152 Transcript_15346/m.33152 type:complete len:170 (-) Transcript_15346:433-942(-)|eukprot:CAMPEP_0118924450 /NCGR_PEP_ID=MMETSP1169-20130426/2582_1 /TAXON_ID=36882 /ORGANISM="Pyramimonas obovata, Strain CCMP722" /LENGTH=169 /DNA_ID=CAMNT_0006865567 /DNA_START=45 /DNA_END=554 /DNA_ORIENTATION=+